MTQPSPIGGGSFVGHRTAINARCRGVGTMCGSIGASVRTDRAPLAIGAMVFCGRCGAESDGVEQRFCVRCGNSLVVRAETPGPALSGMTTHANPSEVGSGAATVGWQQLILQSNQGLWNKVEMPPRGLSAQSAWTFPAELGDFTYVQSFHEDVPDDRMTFEGLDRIGHELEESRGQAYEGVLRTESGARISPPWLHVEDGVVDVRSGRIVMVARVNHQAFGLSPAYETGIGGRNIGKFVEAGHEPGLYFPSLQVYVGSMRTGVMGPVDFVHDAHAVDYHHDRELIGVLTHLGSSTGAVAVIDAAGSWRTLTTVDGLTGGFTPFGFSPDGAWLLVSHHDHVTLVEVDSGRHVAVPVTGGYWWPGSPSSLVAMINAPEGSYLETFDMSSNMVSGRSALIAMDQSLDEGFVMGFHPMPSPDGRRALVSTHAGVRRDYQQKHGCGARLAMVDLATGSGAVLGDIVLNEDLGIERRCSAARWVSRAEQTERVQLHPDLVAQLQSPTNSHEWLAADRWSDEACRLLVIALNSAIRDYQADKHFGAVLPEIAGSLACMVADTSLLEQQRAWLSGVYGHVVESITRGEMAPSDASLWAQFADAYERAVAGRASEVDALRLAWLRYPNAIADHAAPVDVETAVRNLYAQAFPTATADQLRTVERVWERLHSAYENKEPFTVQQIAALSTLVDRLVAENSDLAVFAEQIRDFSRTAMQSGLPLDLQAQWRWFAENA